MNMMPFRPILPLLLLALTGCTIVDSSSVVVGQQRAPIDPSQVTVYLKPPANYEEVALINAKAGHDFKGEQSLTDAAIKRMREEAAKLGANGILLQDVKSRDNPSVTTTYGTATAYGSGGGATAYGTGVGVSRGDSYNRTSGIAIYVTLAAAPRE